MLMVICPVLCLLEERGWETEGIRLIVNVIVVDIVVNLRKGRMALHEEGTR